MSVTNMDFYAEIERLELRLETQRAATIEECARVVESWEHGGLLTDIAAAIRALKDKP